MNDRLIMKKFGATVIILGLGYHRRKENNPIEVWWAEHAERETQIKWDVVP